MSGQLVIVLTPSASNAAAISFNTLFLAPPTATSPDNRVPPVTTNRSLTRPSLRQREPLGNHRRATRPPAGGTV